MQIDDAGMEGPAMPLMYKGAVVGAPLGLRAITSGAGGNAASGSATDEMIRSARQAGPFRPAKPRTAVTRALATSKACVAALEAAWRACGRDPVSFAVSLEERAPASYSAVFGEVCSYIVTDCVAARV